RHGPRAGAAHAVVREDEHGRARRRRVKEAREGAVDRAVDEPERVAERRWAVARRALVVQPPEVVAGGVGLAEEDEEDVPVRPPEEMERDLAAASDVADQRRERALVPA